MLVAKRQVTPEGPWTEKYAGASPTHSSRDELDFLKEENKYSIA